MGWDDLPEELLNLVLSSLFPKDRKTCGLVSRSWNAVVIRSPWLVFYQSSKLMLKFIQFNGVYNERLPELHGVEIRCSKYGWFLMSRWDYTLFFFDPSDKMMIEVPKMEESYASVSFFHPPTSPNCFIFGITDKTKSTSVLIGVLKRGEDKWTCYSYNATQFPFLVSSCTPVLHRGFLYCLDMIGNIGTFNINKGGGCSWMTYTKCLSPPRLLGVIKQHFLFKIKGRKTIFGVFVEHDERKVNVFRLLEPQMRWELVKDLGDKMLYLSHSAAFAETAPKKSMANRIYFPMFHGDKGVFYSLDTRKYHSNEGGYARINSYGFRELHFATWYMPLPTLEPKQFMSWNPKTS